MHEVLTQIRGYLRGIWLRRWYTVVTAWVICVVGWAVVLTIPDRYEASARVYVDTQSILRPLLSGITVTPNIDQTVNMVTRTLLSRPNMEKLARMTDLDVRAKSIKETEALLDNLAANIKLEGGRTGNDIYVIKYQNADPQLAKKVVQSLLTILVESSLGSKRRDTDQARRFVEDQIKQYEQKLVAAENALKDFKQRYMGMMPGQGGDYFSKLAAAQAALSEAQLALREAESRRNQLKRQLEDQQADLEASAPVEVEVSNPELDARIAALEKNLDQMRLTYTERHPDIVATKRVIAQLKEQKREEAKLRKPANPAAPTANTYQQQMSLALAEADATVASLRARVNEYAARYNTLRQQANMLPQVEAELTALNRDYEVHKRNYDQLLARRESIGISEEVESKTEVIDFRVVDPPRVPLTPSFPNRPLLMSLVLLIGIAGGVAVAFLMSQLRPTVSDRAMLRDVVDLPIFGSVSQVWNEEQRKRRARGMRRYFATLGTLLGAYAAVLGATLYLARG